MLPVSAPKEKWKWCPWGCCIMVLLFYMMYTCVCKVMMYANTDSLRMNANHQHIVNLLHRLPSPFLCHSPLTLSINLREMLHFHNTICTSSSGATVSAPQTAIKMCTCFWYRKFKLKSVGVTDAHLIDVHHLCPCGYNQIRGEQTVIFPCWQAPSC